jgi:hypothetical protein
MHFLLAQSGDMHLYGFEGTLAEKVFIGGISAAVLFALVTVKISLRQWLLAGILFANALTPPLAEAGTQYGGTWMLPLQIRRADLHLGISVLLLLTCFATRLSVRWLSAQGLILLAVGLYAALLRFYHDDARTGVESTLFALGVIPVMILVLPLVCGTFEKSMATVRMMVWVSVVWIFCCAVQFVINPQMLLNDNGRFQGMLANPQGAGLWCGAMAVIALGLLLYDPQRRLKLLYIGVLAMNLLFVMWTASRTAAVVAFVGAAVMLVGRGGRSLLLLPGAGLLIILLISLANALGIQENLDRFTSGEDTRTQVWAVQLSQALESPLLGIGIGRTYSENSYLSGFASFGIGMLGLLLLYTLVSGFICLRLYTGRNLLTRPERGLLYMTLSWHAMYFAGALAEGFMIARSSTQQTMMFLFAGVAIYLTSRIEDERVAAEAGPYAHADDDAYGQDGLEHAGDQGDGYDRGLDRTGGEEPARA